MTIRLEKFHEGLRWWRDSAPLNRAGAKWWFAIHTDRRRRLRRHLKPRVRYECRRCPSNNASGSRAGDFAGVRANAGTGGAVRAEQTCGELSGTEPARALFGRTAATRL